MLPHCSSGWKTRIWKWAQYEPLKPDMCDWGFDVFEQHITFSKWALRPPALPQAPGPAPRSSQPLLLFSSEQWATLMMSSRWDVTKASVSHKTSLLSPSLPQHLTVSFCLGHFGLYLICVYFFCSCPRAFNANAKGRLSLISWCVCRWHRTGSCSERCG